jgi:hypothetical protein
MAIFGILTGVSILLVKKYHPLFKAGRDQTDISKAFDWEVGSVFAIVGLVIFYIVACCAFVTQIMDIIKCVTFPEMYIFEYVQGLMNGG